MKKIYLVVGVPGSGKSWVCEQLNTECLYISHDLFSVGREAGTYLNEVLRCASETNDKPLLIETPFSVSKLRDPLMNAGYVVVPVFIVETLETLTSRYEKREGKPLPKGNLTRMNTYAERAKELGAFSGTSLEVLDHLKGLIVVK